MSKSASSSSAPKGRKRAPAAAPRQPKKARSLIMDEASDDDDDIVNGPTDLTSEMDEYDTSDPFIDDGGGDGGDEDEEVPTQAAVDGEIILQTQDPDTYGGVPISAAPATPARADGAAAATTASTPKAPRKPAGKARTMNPSSAVPKALKFKAVLGYVHKVKPKIVDPGTVVHTNLVNKAGQTIDASTVVKCKCGENALLHQVLKDGPNKGRYFLSCPYNGDDSCKYFAFASDPLPPQWYDVAGQIGEWSQEHTLCPSHVLPFFADFQRDVNKAFHALTAKIPLPNPSSV